MSYLRGFTPWIAFGVIPSWQWGALAGLIIGAGLLIHARIAGISADSQILEASTTAFFVALSALAFTIPDSPLKHYAGALSFGWLAITALGTLAIRRPFTLGIAKAQTPREYWDTPGFLSVNIVITSVWALAFAVTTIALAICAATEAPILARVACQVTGFAIPAIFTSRYSAIVKARLAANL
jgi:hypothetical protein